MMFADNVVLNADTREEAEEWLEQWRGSLGSRGMKVSSKKTEYLCIGGGEEEEEEAGVMMQGEPTRALNRIQVPRFNVRYNKMVTQERK